MQHKFKVGDMVKTFNGMTGKITFLSQNKCVLDDGISFWNQSELEAVEPKEEKVEKIERVNIADKMIELENRIFKLEGASRPEPKETLEHKLISIHEEDWFGRGGNVGCSKALIEAFSEFLKGKEGEITKILDNHRANSAGLAKQILKTLGVE